MKLLTEQLPAAQTSGDMVTLNMGISDNADDQLMILNVLSSTLYTDKVSAVLREYGCNAFDANVEAGKRSTPIEVGLPNKLEPSLRIRDFGFGMTEEQIANTFVKLGRSTKRQSNEFTGMLGIGSKSGFAYGDSFMVTSYTGGKKVVYNAFRDKGSPRLARMLMSTTTEPDGIEIKVPIRMEHFEEFRTKAERVYRYFKVRPKITGAQITFLDAERKLSGTGWHYTGRGFSIAIMGNVGYDLSASGMGLESYTGLNYKMAALLTNGVELEFNIGDLEIAASREGLQYKDVTKKAVLARLEVLVDEVGAEFSKQIAGAASEWDARKAYGLLFEQQGNSSIRSLKDVVDGHIKWKGKLINTGRMHIENVDRDLEVNVFQVSKRAYSNRRARYPNATHCYASDVTALVINDLPGKKQSPAREQGFFDDPKNAAVTEWILFTFQSDAAQKKYWKARGLEGAPTINLSSITPAVSAVVAGQGSATYVHNAKHSAKAFVLDETGVAKPYGAARSMWWSTKDIDMQKDGGVYVVLDSFYVKVPSKQLMSRQYYDETPQAFLEKVKILRKAKLIDGAVCGFKISVATKLGPKWVKLEDHIKGKLDVAIAKRGVATIASDYVAAHGITSVVNEKYAGIFPKRSAMRKFLDLLQAKRMPKDLEILNVLLHNDEVAPWMGKPPLVPPSSIPFKNQHDVLYKTYPLLGHIYRPQYMNVTDLLPLAEYVRLMKK